jgi:nitric oxide dioxygenase
VLSVVRAGQAVLPRLVHPVRHEHLHAERAYYYLCGPLPFMQAVRQSLLDRGVPARDIQYEVFGPDLWQADLAREPAPGSGQLGGT